MAKEKPNDKKGKEPPTKESLLNLMRFWLFGTFIIIFVATFVYVGMFANMNWLLVLKSGWYMWVIILVLCVGAYFGYAAYLNKKFDSQE